MQRIALVRGIAASELALVAGGGHVVADGYATRRGTATVLRLLWRVRGGGCGASRTRIVAEGCWFAGEEAQPQAQTGGVVGVQEGFKESEPEEILPAAAPNGEGGEPALGEPPLI
jgi:hypothetical protein